MGSVNTTQDPQKPLDTKKESLVLRTGPFAQIHIIVFKLPEDMGLEQLKSLSKWRTKTRQFPVIKRLAYVPHI